MGGSDSKESEATKPMENKGIVESSSGFHILEIHVPTVGYGFVFIIIAMVVAMIAYACYRKLKRRWTHPGRHRRQRQEHHQWPMPSVSGGMPMVIMAPSTPNHMWPAGHVPVRSTSRIRELNPEDLEEEMEGGEEDLGPQRGRQDRGRREHRLGSSIVI
jgi:hypothetical protein